LYIALSVLDVSLRWCKHADFALITYSACCAYPFKGICIPGAELCICCTALLVSSFKQYFSPPINAFVTLCICHAAKCKTSSNRNVQSILLPQYVQLGVQVIFLQGVTRHMQHGEGLQARLLTRLACMQAAVKQGNLIHVWHVWQPYTCMALNTGPLKAAGTVTTLGNSSGLLRLTLLTLSTSSCLLPAEAQCESQNAINGGQNQKGKHCSARWHRSANQELQSAVAAGASKP